MESHGVAAEKETEDVEGGMRWTEKQKTSVRRVDREEEEEEEVYEERDRREIAD